MRPVSGSQLRSVSTAIDLRPARIVAIGAIGGDVPFVRAQRAAGGALALGRRLAATAKTRELVERAIVVRERWRAGLAGDPVDAAARARVEHLLAREPRRPGAVRIRQPAQDHFGRVAGDAHGLAAPRARTAFPPMAAATRLRCRHRAIRRRDAAFAPRPGHSPPRRAWPSSPRRRARSHGHDPVPSLPRPRPRRLRRRTCPNRRACSGGRPRRPRRPAPCRCSAQWRVAVRTGRRACRRSARPAAVRKGQAAPAARGRGRRRRVDSAAEQQVELPQSKCGALQSSFHPNADAIAWIRHGRSHCPKP